MDADAPWAARYPDLFRPHPHSWDGVTGDYTLQLTLTLPLDQQVVNVRLVAVHDGKVVVCTTAEGWRTLPGGSRLRLLLRAVPTCRRTSRRLLLRHDSILVSKVRSLQETQGVQKALSA